MSGARNRTLGPLTVELRKSGKWVQCNVWLTLDEHGLAKNLGQKALENRSRISRLANGLVTAEVREVKP